MQDGRHGERHDQRRKAEIADAEPIHSAYGGRDSERERDRSETGRVDVEGKDRENNGGDRDHRAHREIDAAADHRDGLTDADQADHRGQLDDVAEMGVGAEAREQKRAADPENCDNCVGSEGPAVFNGEASQEQNGLHRCLRREARIRGSATVATMINP